MMNLHSAFEDFAPDVDLAEPEIDRDFITAFLLPYFNNLPREELAAALDEVIALEENRLVAATASRRRSVIDIGHGI